MSLGLRRVFLVSSVLVLLGLSGCSTLSENQCKQGDWFSIGLKDGSEGYGSDRLSKHSEACKDYGVSPNLTAYEKGRGEGLQTYCSPENGFRTGRNGGYYRGGCPAALESGFLRKFEAGKQLYTIESRVNSLYQQITGLENDMDKETDVNRRAQIRERLRDRQREREELQRRMTVLEIKGDG